MRDLESMLFAAGSMLCIIIALLFLREYTEENIWYEESITYAYHDPDNSKFVLTVGENGELERIKISLPEDEYEFGDEICLLTEEFNVFVKKRYTVIECH